MGTLRQLIIAMLMACCAVAADSSGSGAAATIQLWHDDAGTVAGDTYRIDAGTYTWDDGSNDLVVTKAVNIIGAGEGLTFIEDDSSDSGGISSRILQISTSGTHRISGITFQDTSGPTHSGANWQIVVYNCNGLSLDNLTFEKETTGSTASRRPFAFQAGSGDVIPMAAVIWGCTFNQQRQTAYVRNNGSALGSDWGDYGWNNDPAYGTQNQIVWEDNTFGVDASLDGDGGSWSTYRFNTTTANVFYHGSDSTTGVRGGRMYEYYHNTFTADASYSSNRCLELRSGQAIVFNNSFTNNASDKPSKMAEYHAYRTGFSFKPWGVADGYVAWDYPDLTDTGTGDDNTAANDGIFWTGTIATKDSTSTLTVDGSPGWTNDQWAGYTCRLVGPSGTMAAGSSGHTLVVANQTWSAGEWNDYLVLNETDNKVNYVRSHNTPTASDGTMTIGGGTVSTDGWRDFAADSGDTFVVYHASRILSNDANSLTLWTDAFDATWDFINANATVEIRRLDGILDGVGMGTATSDFPRTGSTMDEKNVGQDATLRPVYMFNNTFDGSKTLPSGGWTLFSSSFGGNSIREDVHHFNHVELGSFDGSTGVSVGTKAQMNAITPTTDNVAFWVTDEGEWWADNAGTDGQLYQWNGSAWVLYYTPLTYPHPIRASFENSAGAAYGGRLRFNGTGAKPIRTDGTGQPIIFDQ